MLKKKLSAKLSGRAFADDVDRQIKSEQGRAELRPAQGNGEMVGIAQIEAKRPSS
jgi:hypothetical protein